MKRRAFLTQSFTAPIWAQHENSTNISRTVYPSNLDVTHTLQTALDEVEAAGGGIVWLQAGIYYITEIRIPPNTHLRGESSARRVGYNDVTPGSLLVALPNSKLKNPPEPNADFPSLIRLQNSRTGKGGRVSNLSIDIGAREGVFSAVDLIGAWHFQISFIFVYGVGIDQFGIHTRIQHEGTYWGTISQCFVEATGGTGYRFSNIKVPGGRSDRGRSNQLTIAQCKVDGADIGFDLNGCGGGMLFLNCQAENLGSTSTGFRVRNNTQTASPVWYSGEVNGSVDTVAFDGRVVVYHCALPSLKSELRGGAIRVSSGVFGGQEEISVAGGEPYTHCVRGGFGHRVSYIRYVREYTWLELDSPLLIAEFPYAQNDCADLRIFLVVRYKLRGRLVRSVFSDHSASWTMGRLVVRNIKYDDFGDFDMGTRDTDIVKDISISGIMFEDRVAVSVEFRPKQALDELHCIVNLEGISSRPPLI